MYKRTSTSPTRIAVIGGGAAGFFGAITAAEHFPGARLTLLEKSGRLLTKVAISGGGRCNVTHSCFDPDALARAYPRGERELRGAFHTFQARDTVAWFESRGVPLKAEPDGRMFPVTDSSATVTDCLIREARRGGVEVRTRSGVTAIDPADDGTFALTLASGERLTADRVLVATGGAPKLASFAWLAALGHRIEPPVPSLFTFNLPHSPLAGLQGISVEDALVRIPGTRLAERGPLLVTHWGLSGPAVLRLSAWGARELHEREYRFSCHVSFLPEFDEERLRSHLSGVKQAHATRRVSGDALFGLPARLWTRLTEQAGIEPDTRWADLPRTSLFQLVEWLLRGRYEVAGKTTFKEEFVTCGGVSRRDVDFGTMQSRRCPGLFLAGEVLDVDGITGGFNFQNAWTTGYIAGRSMGR